MYPMRNVKCLLSASRLQLAHDTLADLTHTFMLAPAYSSQLIKHTPALLRTADTVHDVVEHRPQGQHSTAHSTLTPSKLT